MILVCVKKFKRPMACHYLAFRLLRFRSRNITISLAIYPPVAFSIPCITVDAFISIIKGPFLTDRTTPATAKSICLLASKAINFEFLERTIASVDTQRCRFERNSPA